MKINYEKSMCKVFAYMFAGISIFCLVSGFMGYRWHFYTAVLSGMVSAIIFAVIRHENRNPPYVE